MDDFFREPVFTPFLRRFTDERARDLTDTQALYERVKRAHEASPFSAPDADLRLTDETYAQCRDAPEPLRTALLDAIIGVVMQEEAMLRLPVLDLATAHLSLKESVDMRRFLRAKEHFHANEAKVGALFKETLALIFGTISQALPETVSPSPFTMPLVLALPEPKRFLSLLMGEFWKEQYADAGLFTATAHQLYANACKASGIADPQNPKKPLKLPQDSDEPLEEIVRTYFAGTPFHKLLLSPLPLKFTTEDRFSHMHVVGGSGAGKTTLLQNLILHDLQTDDPPSLFIVDSQGDLIEKLSHLSVFGEGGRLADRFLLITPKDTRHPPAINIFDVNRERLREYDEAAKEQVTAGVIQTFDYLFAGLLGADLTAKQGVFFRFVARLMLALPETMGRNATILDMLALMDDATPYRAAIEKLPPIQRQFFERDFASKTFSQTKEQIRYRLNAVLENPTLARLFTSTHTRIDLFDVLNSGGIVLIDTAKDFLKGASGHFGRIFISLVLQAVLERAAIPEGKRRPTFLIVDEAAAYFDSNIDDFLTEARKYKCGCVFAHQFLDQATSSLRASLAANTTIKMAGGVSTGDARALAPDMRTTADFILGQPRLHFACYARNATSSAVSMPVPVGQLEAEPRLSEEAYAALMARNRERVSNEPNPQSPRQPEHAAHTEDLAHEPKVQAADPTEPTREW